MQSVIRYQGMLYNSISLGKIKQVNVCNVLLFSSYRFSKGAWKDAE